MTLESGSLEREIAGSGDVRWVSVMHVLSNFCMGNDQLRISLLLS